jgi:hypothetical protein
MKKIIFGLMLLSALAMTTSVLAAPGRGMGGWGAGSQYGRMYDTKTVETWQERWKGNKKPEA